MAAPKEIHDLIERFERNLDAYKAGQYNETQVRREFIDPFFKQLGWDIDNTADTLRASGWKVLRVWEHSLKNECALLRRLKKAISG